jgi:hypothetical protein
MRLYFIALAAVGAWFAASSPAAATPGRTDANGCHTDRSGGTGYHCHNGGSNAPPAAKPTSAQAPARRSAAGEVFYQNCSAARAAGAAPIRRGEPGYAPKLDRDNDGIACE